MSLIIAAPASGSGKTTITLGLLHALSRITSVRGAKSGPDYIDPRFHEAACGQPCYNLDAWAMTPARIRSLAAGPTPLIIEGAMGLFDGAPPDGTGATADLARLLDLPVLLVVDAASMAQSIAPLVQGFADHDPKVRVGGVILNRVGSARHDRMLRTALAPTGIPVLGAIPRDAGLARPSRHLGLIQAGEMTDLAEFLSHAADRMEQHLDLGGIRTMLHPISGTGLQNTKPDKHIKGKRIALAQDAAFAFAYASDLATWDHHGATILPFSPLANEPVPEADQIILPGGYPELYAGQIASADRFLNSLRHASQTTDIYGECGGYMVLGETLISSDGVAHEMAGLLRLETSFATRKLHLGYRTLTHHSAPDGPSMQAHEFHYATTLRATGQPLFDATDAEGTKLPAMGLIDGRVCGSFAHLIDGVPGLTTDLT